MIEVPKESEINAAIKYPNICKLGDDNVLEFYCDNQTLSSLRACPGYFKESFINELEPKPYAAQPTNFALDFGIWFHDVMEQLDKRIMAKDQMSLNEALFLAKKLWFSKNLELYRGSKPYEMLDGFAGALQVIADYINFFQPSQLNTTKIIATELIFGYDKEAPIVDWEEFDLKHGDSAYKYRAYLVGRPDGIIETQLGIGPKDFKTATRMDMVVDMYKPSDQLMGYVYGVNKIFAKSQEFKGKKCNTAYLIAVSKKAEKDPKNRVRMVPYTYSDLELEHYRMRQVATFDLLYEQLVLGTPTFWDTSKCTNWYFKTCPFHKLHSNDSAQRDSVIEAFYQKKTPWNPRTRGREAAAE